MNFLETPQEERIATRRARIMKALELDKQLNARASNINHTEKNKYGNKNTNNDEECVVTHSNDNNHSEYNDKGEIRNGINVDSIDKLITDKSEAHTAATFLLNDATYNSKVNVANDFTENETRRARTEMDVMLTCMEEALTDVKLNADTAEKMRRQRDKVSETTKHLEQEALEKENEMNATAIQMKFEALYNLTIPHELYSAIGEQREACSKLLSQKENIIESLENDLRERESAYVELLQRNREEMDKLIETMHNTTNEYEAASTKQLNSVENIFANERTAFLTKCDVELNELTKQRRTREMEYRRQRETKLVNAQDNLLEKHNDMYEEFNNVQQTHCDQINILRQELEKCKADFMLNGERLSYNLQVLRERVKENTATENACKRKLAKLQETLSVLIARHKESEKRYEKQNKELTTQLHRVGAQYKDMQDKFQLFEHNDKSKYRQLWTTHDQKCKELVHRVLQADRVVFEDVLQMPWSPPEITFGMEGVSSNRWSSNRSQEQPAEYDKREVDSIGNTTTTGTTTNNNTNEYHNDNDEQVITNFDTNDSSDNDDDDDDDDDDDNNNGKMGYSYDNNNSLNTNNGTGGFDSGTISRKFITDAGIDAITGAGVVNEGSSTVSPPAPIDLNESELVLLNILRSQAPFLVDANVRAAITQISGTTEEQAEIEGILTTLRIVKNEELQNMLEYFMIDGEYNTRALIHPQECLRALNAFLNERAARQVAAAQRKAARVRMTSKMKQKAKRAVEDALAEEKYWKSLTKVIPETHLHIWQALEEGLEVYLAQLQQRKGLIETADSLRAQNTQLKSLIQQYMQSDINYKLYSAPRLIRQTN